MEKMVGIIGPTDLPRMGRVLGRTVRSLTRDLEFAGKLLATTGYVLLVTADDKGVPFLVAKAYKKHGGRRLVMLAAKEGVPWPAADTSESEKIADELDWQENWFWVNYIQVSKPDISICLGLSPGTGKEVADFSWNMRLRVPQNLRLFLAVRSFLQDGSFPSWLGDGLPVQYVDTVQDLEAILDENEISANPPKALSA